MPTEDEVYDMFLANAGKCPKCGEFLIIKRTPYGYNNLYKVIKKCLSCDYETNISNSYNEAIGLKEAIPEPPYIINEMEKKQTPITNQKEPIRNLPYSYFKVNDVLEREIKCPKCGSVNSFDIIYNHEIRDLVHKCNECDTEFVLKDIDYSTGIGVAIIVKTSSTREVCK